MSDEPRDALHDYGVPLRHEWRHRDEIGGDHDMVLVLESLEGEKVRLHLEGDRDIEGELHLVRQGEEGDVEVVGVRLEPGCATSGIPEIISIAALPDPTMAHNSEPPGTPEI
jgi:hypothetical protein